MINWFGPHVCVAFVFFLSACGPRSPGQLSETRLVSQKNDNVGPVGKGRKEDKHAPPTRDEPPPFQFSFSMPEAPFYTIPIEACVHNLESKTSETEALISTALQIDCRLNQSAQTMMEMVKAGMPVTSRALTETLWWHGVPEATQDILVLRLGDKGRDKDEHLKQKIENWLKNRETEGANRYGMVIRKIVGGHEAVIIAVKTHLTLDPLPRQVKAKARIRMNGRIDLPHKSVQVVITGPKGRTFRPEVKDSRHGFSSTFKTREKGLWQIEVIVDSQKGPTALANFPVAVGVSHKKVLVLEPVRLESDNPSKLAQILFERLNQERQGIGLNKLKWSSALAKVAGRYSVEMADTGVVAHLSPHSGSVRERVQAAGIELAGLSENLAKAGTALEAHEGLMGSPAHRANILNPLATETGIGVTVVGEGKASYVIVTQIFALKKTVEPVPRAGDLVKTINRIRKKGRLKPYSEHAWLKKMVFKIGARCFEDPTPEIGVLSSAFKSVKVVAFRTNSVAATVGKVAGLYTQEGTNIGVHLQKQPDPDGEIVCVTVLIGQRK